MFLLNCIWLAVQVGIGALIIVAVITLISVISYYSAVNTVCAWQRSAWRKPCSEPVVKRNGFKFFIEPKSDEKMIHTRNEGVEGSGNPVPTGLSTDHQSEEKPSASEVEAALNVNSFLEEKFGI